MVKFQGNNKKRKVVDEIEVKKSTSKIVSKWLEEHFPKLQKVYTDKKKVFEILGELKFDNDVDKKWYQSFMMEAKKKKDIEVSDHALLRYIERIAGKDVEVLRNDIKQLIKTSKMGTLDVELIGNCSLTIEGITFIIKDRVVVTIMEK